MSRYSDEAREKRGRAAVLRSLIAKACRAKPETQRRIAKRLTVDGAIAMHEEALAYEAQAAELDRQHAEYVRKVAAVTR